MRECVECIREGKLTLVAIYSNTLCPAHWIRQYEAVLASVRD